VANEAPTSSTVHESAWAAPGTGGAAIALGAVVFFAGSAVLTQSGEPGASTPVPWMVSHFLWFVATALVAVGTVAVRRHRAFGTGLAATVAGGAFGLAVLHALQWTAWVYVDVFARQQGAHGTFHGPLLHPFGTAHAMMYGVLLGGGIAALALALVRSGATHRLLDYAGLAVGGSLVVAASAGLLTVADVRTPVSLATILLTAGGFAWLFAAGLSVSRADGPRRGRE
jgi:hypothetical protein